MQVDQSRLKMKLQRCSISDGFLKTIAAHVAQSIFVRTECVKGIAVRAVDRRAGQAKQKRIGQRLTHLASQVAFLRAVGFIHQRNDVAAVIQATGGFTKLEDRGNDDLAHVLPKQLLQLLAGVRLLQIGDVSTSESAGDLAVQINAIHHNDHRRILQV